jgi:hypothetical protein
MARMKFVWRWIANLFSPLYIIPAEIARLANGPTGAYFPFGQEAQTRYEDSLPLQITTVTLGAAIIIVIVAVAFHLVGGPR